MPTYGPGEKRPRTFYGDPDEPIEDLMKDNTADDSPPEVGDELCDGHQAHYVWNGEKWQ